MLRPVEQYLYPDNVFDDGDLDLFAGFSVYYSGSPGVEIGNFQILFEDALGNQARFAGAAAFDNIRNWNARG